MQNSSYKRLLMPVRKYTYYDFTLSLCPECLRRVDAKIVFENNNVYMLKRCSEHGNSKVLIADDIDYYKNIRNYNKPSETPYSFNTKTRGFVDSGDRHESVENAPVLSLFAGKHYNKFLKFQWLLVN